MQMEHGQARTVILTLKFHFLSKNPVSLWSSQILMKICMDWEVYFIDKAVELELAVGKRKGIPSCSMQENKEYF